MQQDSMIEMFVFETTQIIEQLEQTILDNEASLTYSKEVINEVFRHMHTIKGSAAMMFYNSISNLAHSIEDVFFFLREEKPKAYNGSLLSDLVLESIDFIKVELEKIKNGDEIQEEAPRVTQELKSFLNEMKRERPNEKSLVEKIENLSQITDNEEVKRNYVNKYKAKIFFEDGCEMENVRAYTIIHNLENYTNQYTHVPENIIDNEKSMEDIRENGFIIYFQSDQSYQEAYDFFMETVFLKQLELIEIKEDKVEVSIDKEQGIGIKEKTTQSPSNDKKMTQHSMISVNVNKLDQLMDLVGEMVIAESMVVQNPDLEGLQLDNFYKASRLLNKITSELQDMVMSIRMVPLANTFHKMHRIVRDMNKKLGKKVELHIVGEETEVDKNIIEHISDPLMHLVRNAIDHGIESKEERLQQGKSEQGSITLEAKNAGSDVVVLVKDNGKGLNKDKILEKASKNNLLTKPIKDMTDKEIYALIFLPGFSTKVDVTEFSGRGVGMDVVSKNIESIGGYVSVDSIPRQGTTITIKIPLTLAIIEGMNIRVGQARYTIPINTIKESFKVKESQIIRDPDGYEMIMVRGQCYPILRLHQYYNVHTSIEHLSEGILIMVENDGKKICLFADELVGQQQVVVKGLPTYINNVKKIKGMAGCTLLGDGSISLILDIPYLVQDD